MSSTNPHLDQMLLFTFLANSGFFEFLDLFHEKRLAKLVCLLSGRGPGGLREASYVQISFKTLSGGLFSVWSPERLLYFQNVRNSMVSFKSCVPDAMPAGDFWAPGGQPGGCVLCARDTGAQWLRAFWRVKGSEVEKS